MDTRYFTLVREQNTGLVRIMAVERFHMESVGKENKKSQRQAAGIAKGLLYQLPLVYQAGSALYSTL